MSRKPVPQAASIEPSTDGLVGDTVAVRTAWRRTGDDQGAIAAFGARLRHLREEAGLTLAEASATTGIPSATLSRIETSRMSPTLAVLLKLLRGLDLSWGQLMDSGSIGNTEGFLSFSGDQSPTVAVLPATRYELPHGDAGIPLSPMLLTVLAQSPDEIGGLTGHPGHEFCRVLEGVLELHFEGLPPRRLLPGESALFESTRPHAYVAADGAPARVLLVATRAVAGPPDASADIVQLHRKRD